jgi:general secretion pathway protein K
MDPRRRSRPRGATLLIAISAIAILTAIATDLAYNVRVSLQIAVNGRDELRALYMAKSAVAFSRLVLRFQRQMDATSGAAQQAAGPLGGGLTGIHLWELIPVDSSAMALFLSGDQREEAAHATASGAGAQGASASLGDKGESDTSLFTDEAAAPGKFEGSFSAKIEDEGAKINVSQFAGMATSGVPVAQLIRLQELINDRSYDFLFEHEDANGIRATRNDLIIALKDWVDEDEVTSALGTNPVMPFETAFGDENINYSRLDPPYKAKNARFDSLDELYMVSGVTDAFMAAFGDKLTIYPDVNQLISLQTNDPLQMLNEIKTVADLTIDQPAFRDPQFLPRLQAALALANPIGLVPVKVKDFMSILSGLGVKLKPGAQQGNSASVPLTDLPPTVFHIRATGKAGEVEKTLDAVVTFGQGAGSMAYDLGRLIHWREE